MYMHECVHVHVCTCTCVSVCLQCMQACIDADLIYIDSDVMNPVALILIILLLNKHRYN